jgi:CheY-like chemotaxis protein
MLSVRDDGRGMDQETLARIFDPFFTTKAPGQGTGLGLSVVHGVMRSLGGAVTVQSEREQGALFRLFFPVVQGEHPVRERAHRSARGQGQRILLVDDEAAVVAVTKAGLERFGFVVEAFTDPVAALRAFRRPHADYAAMVTDLAMPGMTGFELTMAVRSLRPAFPVLLMSGYLGPDEQRRAEDLGIRELVAKPVGMAELAARLERLLSRSQSARASA